MVEGALDGALDGAAAFGCGILAVDGNDAVVDELIGLIVVLVEGALVGAATGGMTMVDLAFLAASCLVLALHKSLEYFRALLA